MQPFQVNGRRHRHHHHPGYRVLFGLGVIGVGVLALLDNLRLFDIALLRTFWPLALVLWGLGRLAWPRHGGSGLFGLALIAMGLALTAQHLGYLQFHWRDWWPVFVIAIGLSILMRGFFPRRDRQACFEVSTLEHGDVANIHASFGAVNQRQDSRQFKGGRIEATFGGVELDLTQAAIDGPEARLDIAARFSGIELRVPRDWQVVVEMAATFGGVEDKTVPPMSPVARLVLRGEVVFGGVEIKN